jgi:CRP/FNR family transcriptional regulator, cyclic AMP receptor protein
MNTNTRSSIEDYATSVATDLLHNSSLGDELTEGECKALSGVIRVSGLKDGVCLIDENKVDNSIHVIIDGELEVLKKTDGGDVVLLHVLKKGDMAGELGFLDGMAHAASLRARGDTVIYSISRSDLEAILYTDPDVVYKVMRAITRTVHSIVRRMNSQFIAMSNYINHQHGLY